MKDKMIVLEITFQNCKVLPRDIINQRAVFLFQSDGSGTRTGLPGLYFIIWPVPEAKQPFEYL